MNNPLTSTRRKYGAELTEFFLTQPFNRFGKFYVGSEGLVVVELPAGGWKLRHLGGVAEKTVEKIFALNSSKTQDRLRQ